MDKILIFVDENYRKLSIKILTIILFVICTLQLNSQTSNFINPYPLEDNRAWGSIDLKYKIDKNTDLEFSQGFRYFNNRNDFAQSITEIGITYEIFKNFKFNTTYRLRYENLSEDKNIDLIETESNLVNELRNNIQYKFEYKNLDISNRIRYQLRTRSDNEPRHIMRYKITTAYNSRDKSIKFFRGIKPYISFETFYRFFHPNIDMVYQNRYSTGLAIKLTKKQEIEIFLIREYEFTKKAINSTILGLNYSLELN